MIVVAKEKPEWVKRLPAKEFVDEELIKIITFYLFHSPCNGLSAMQKSLKDYNWHTPWRLPYKLNSQLKQASSNFNLIFSAKSYATLDEALKKADLLDNFPSNLKCERIGVYDNKSNQFISVFYHIRNAFAHGRFCIKENTFVFEDKYGTKVSARMILKKKTLLKWIEIIEGGEKEYLKQ